MVTGGRFWKIIDIQVYTISLKLNTMQILRLCPIDSFKITINIDRVKLHFDKICADNICLNYTTDFS